MKKVKSVFSVIYDEVKKAHFLNQFENLSTREVYMRIFKQSSKLENEIGKDLFNFNQDELERFIKEYIKPKTKQSARTYINVISSYIQWGIDNKYSKLSTNPLRRNQDYFYNFVEDQNNLYMSKEEVEAITFGLVNAQDKFIIQALFDGIQGTQVSELTTLTVDQIEDALNNDNNLFLVDKKGNKRIVNVDETTLNLALLANSESRYFKKNGNVDYLDNLKDDVILPKSKYILKPTATNKDAKVVSVNPVSHYTVYNRLEMIKGLEGFEEYRDALQTKNIVRSGMIYEAKKMIERGEELNKQNIEKICDKFGIKYKWSLRDFLNEETIREVYSL